MIPPAKVARSNALRLLLLALGLFAPLVLHAATNTWDGGGGNGLISNPTNWAGDIAPLATGDSLVFAGTVNLAVTNDAVTSLGSTSFTFASGAGAFTISGNAITVGNSSSNDNLVTKASAADQTISANLNLAGGQRDRTIIMSGGGKLVFSGNVNFNNDWLFATTSAGTIVLSGNNSGDGKGSVIIAGTNLLRAMMRNNVAGTVLTLGSDTALGNAGSGTTYKGLVANQNMTINTIGNRNLAGSTIAINTANVTYNGAENLTIGNLISQGGNRDFWITGAGAVTVAGNVFLDADQIGGQWLYLNVTNGTRLTVGGSVHDTFHSEGLTNSYSTLFKAGGGTLVLNGGSAYAGLTRVDAGVLLVNGTHAPVSDSRGYALASSATLGGIGTIRPYASTAGSEAMISASNSAIVSPGVSGTSNGLGTLTLDGVNTVRPLMALASGASIAVDLGSSLASDKISLTNGAAGDLSFSNNTLNFNDTTSGNLVAGNYVLVSADAASFSGMGTNAEGVITNGLVIGTGLEAYAGSTLRIVDHSIVLALASSNGPVPVALGFNLKAAANTGLTPAELAGAPGVRFANWNNLNIASGSGSIANMVDSTGAAVTGVSVAYAAGNGGNAFSRNYSSPTNDVRMFDTVIDKYDGAEGKITVTGIPYAAYDVYFYMSDDGAARGGRFTVGGTTYYLRGGAGLPNGAGSGYVQSTDTNFNSGSDTQANYVKFSGLSGDLTATFTAVNQGDSVQRLKFPGFQIVGTAAPASTPPSAPADVTIVANSSTSYTIAWNAAGGATGYQIFRSTVSGQFDYEKPLATVAAPGTSYTDGAANVDGNYYYTVRAVNAAGSSESSMEVGNPPPNLDSVAASSAVLWPGQSSTISWSVPNATGVSIYDGTVTNIYPASTNVSVSPATNTIYTFTATNAQGATIKEILVNVVPKPETRDSLWQWSVTVTNRGLSGETQDYPRAFLYIPPGVKRLRGVIIGQHNMLEEPILEHKAVRQGLADASMAAIWVSPAFDGVFNFTTNTNTPVAFQEMMDKLAEVSGYSELSKAPVVWIGHSAMAEAPYFFAAWDTQNSVATGAPKRCAAALSVKGWYPGKHDATTPTYANSDLAGVPIMYIEGEYADANGRAGGALGFRNATVGSIVSYFSDVGGGHFDWNDNICEYIGMYLRKLGQYRLPDALADDGAGALKTINASMQGWMADRWRKGTNPAATPAAVGSYTGATNEAFWYFDQEHAQSTYSNQLPVKTQYQLVGYTTNGVLVDQKESHLQVEPSFVPDPSGDGLTFKFCTAFLTNVPATSSRLTGWTGLPVGSVIGHSTNGPILINRVCGPVEQLSPDTFRISFDRVGTENRYGQTRSRDMVFTAVHPGDTNYVRAVQQAQIRIPLPLTNGTVQTITFPTISDQSISTATIPLTATTSGTNTYAGAKVDFYVIEGPAKVVNGNTLQLTPLPPRTKFPVKVTVVGTQYGRNIAPLLQTATPVTNTFFITATDVEQWRLQNFATPHNAGDAADTADPDADGRENGLERSMGSDPNAANLGNLDRYQTWARGTNAPTQGTIGKYAFGGATGPDAVAEAQTLANDASNNLVLSAIVRTNNPDGLSIFGQYTTDLAGTWANLPVNPAGVRSTDASPVPSGCERRDFSTPMSGVKKFLRLKADFSE